MSKGLNIRVWLGYRRYDNYDNSLSLTYQDLSLGKDTTLNNIKFIQVRKAIKDYIAMWNGRGEIEIHDVKVISSGCSRYKKHKNVLKINGQLLKNMVGKTYQFNN